MAAKKKPLRTLKEPLFPPDSFTVEQARAAVLAVMKERGIPIRPDVVERDPRYPPRYEGHGVQRAG
ncbi:hypothetical protein [Longimicrobium sp.]|uniref:hypothetical protein n=1 Tax=Longimicrobium sp. TaxID=2029185 RepID=UPI002C222793|nr:hypothetical protein [Longimicrobium sp.]HSU13717.1 hypothetical protein [Longimicrobium sp.]